MEAFARRLVTRTKQAIVSIAGKARKGGRMAFTKGNTYGVVTRFQPGRSGNPDGRPHGFAATARKQLEELPPKEARREASSSYES